MKKITIINTVCLPVKTGPSYTGNIRGEFLNKIGYSITLLYPYLVTINDQLTIYKCVYTKECFIDYLRTAYNISPNIQVTLYDVKYDKLMRMQMLMNTDKTLSLIEGLLIVEDPEPFLFALHPIAFAFLTRKRDVVFIFHTQYKNISKHAINNPLYNLFTDMLCKCYLNLYSIQSYGLYISDALLTEKCLGTNKHHIVSNIHGVNDKYFIDHVPTNNSIYFIGKLDIVHKNLQLMKRCAEKANEQITVFGDGVDKEFIVTNEKLFNYKGLTSCIDDLNDYGIYVSFSFLEGLCTATAEAIVMNKRCIVLDCECNNGFRKYKNVYFFNDETDFVTVLDHVKCQPVHLDENKDDFRWSNCNQQLLNEFRNFGLL